MPMEQVKRKPGRPRSAKYEENHSYPSRSSSDSSELADAKLAKIKAETNKINLDIEIKKREYIPIVEVSSIVATEYTRVRQKLLSLESKLSHSLAPITDPIKIKEIIQQEVDEVLQELSADQQYMEEDVGTTKTT